MHGKGSRGLSSCDRIHLVDHQTDIGWCRTGGSILQRMDRYIRRAHIIYGVLGILDSDHLGADVSTVSTGIFSGPGAGNGAGISATTTQVAHLIQGHYRCRITIVIRRNYCGCRYRIITFDGLIGRATGQQGRSIGILDRDHLHADVR